MDDITYILDCEMCGVTTSIVVHDIDEKPIFCPMCGTEAKTVEEI